jgi:peptide/nickel transport system substrate-binding protein
MATPLDPVSLSRRGLLRLTAAGAVLAGFGGTLAACSSAADPNAAAGSGGGSPRPGGRLRVGVVGGSAKDSLNAHGPVTHPDEARVINLYDTLTCYDESYKIQMALAESVEPSADAKKWRVRLKDGIEFHNGKTVTAEDVVFTFMRITDPKSPQSGAAGLSALERGGLKALDKRTVEFPFRTPFVNLDDALAQYANGIVPVGYDPKTAVGAGPFQLVSFTPGQQSVFKKHPNYWRKGQPYLDEVVIVDFPDDTARVNALLGGQVDAIDQLPLAQINVVKANAGLRVLESQTGAWLPFTMRVDRPPFDDVRVRQALRLVVDRKQMVEQVLSGHGVVANDVYARFDPAYNSGLPQRQQDIAQARSLLKQAGKENLSIELVTSPVAAGLVEAAQVFANQAKAAGVTVNVRKVQPSEFYGDNYLKWDFAQDFWFTRDFLPQAANGSLPKAPYNETHWDDDEWKGLVDKAMATLDDTERAKLIKAAQQIEYDRGGYIIWGFPNQVDAFSRKVSGLVPDRSGIPLTSYGFRRVWLSA